MKPHPKALSPFVMSQVESTGPCSEMVYSGAVYKDFSLGGYTRGPWS